jgi:hypothetical protein
MSEPEHEHDEEAAETPVDEPGPSDDEQAEEEAHEAEEAAQEPTEASVAKSGEEPGEPDERRAPPVDAAKEQRRLAAALKREQEAHSKKLEKVLGEAHEHVLLCPLCGDGLQGYVFPGDGQMLSDEDRATVLGFIGVERPVELREAEGVVMCDRCDGMGELKYPSRKALLATQPCPACNGNGYKLDVQQPANVSQFPTAPTQPAVDLGAQTAACPLCGAPNSAGRPHFCNPTQAVAT